jgi:tol-pal system protein YbgF
MSFDAGKRCLLVAVLAGCGHTDSDKAASDLNRQVQSLRAQNSAYAKQVEELENRVFIMSDQMDGKKEEAPRAAKPGPALPKVTLHPAERAATIVAEEPSDDPTQVDVEYAGEAAKTSGKRPLLKLYGDDVPVMSTVDREPPPAPRERRVLVMPRESRQETRPAPSKVASASEGLELYRRSLEALRGGRHVEAAAGFRDFLKQHPRHDFADNAQYWLGECYYDQKDYPMAVREFRRVVEKYPQGNKVPDALLKVAFSHLALGSAEVGRQTLEQLVRSYPRHEAAGIASAKLSELGRATPSGSGVTKTEARSAKPAEESP